MRQRVEGRLDYDSARIETVVGEEPALWRERDLAYHSEELCIELHVEGSPEGFGVYHGQVVGNRQAKPVGGARIALGDYESVVTTDEFGQFAVSSLAASPPRVLRVLTEGTEVVCPIPDGDG